MVIGAHPDDEVYTCGGTNAALAARGDEVYVLILTEGCTSQYADAKKMIKQKKDEAARVADILGVREYTFADLPDMRLDTLPHVEVNAPVEKAVQRIQPHIVLTHHREDLNLDHSLVAHSTLVACRPASAPSLELVASYEGAPGGMSFAPNWYVDVSGKPLEKKLEAAAAYKSEMRPFPHFRSIKAIEALAAMRGAEAGMEAAEAFVIIKKLGI
jgi:LmbE family N-acetylglucosaminyl deacetylase